MFKNIQVALFRKVKMYIDGLAQSCDNSLVSTLDKTVQMHSGHALSHRYIT